MKSIRTENYNYNFNYENGFFARWGKTYKDDPEYSPMGPELADIEVSTICHGPFEKPCPWCYKSNHGQGWNMSLESFVQIVKRLNSENNLMQIAFGIGDIDANFDLIPMFTWCRENNIVPNVTVNGAKLDKYFMNKTYYQHIADLCGAVAVSHYDDDLCFNAVEEFTDRGMTQVNIHKILAEETVDDCIALLKKTKIDNRLDKLNAIVFLLLKPKGDRNTLTPITNMKKYKELIMYAIDNNINIGFDSCGANKFLEAVKDLNNFDYHKTIAEPCESGLFSIYVNVYGEVYPCSFSEGIDEWSEGISLLEYNDFITDVWFGERLSEFRHKCIKNNRSCIFYDV